MREITYAAAGIEAVCEEMRVEPKSVSCVADGHESRHCSRSSGRSASRRRRIAEGALTGISIGAAGSGYRRIMDWRQVTFLISSPWTNRESGRQVHYSCSAAAPRPDPLSRQRRRRRAAGGDTANARGRS